MQKGFLFYILFCLKIKLGIDSRQLNQTGWESVSNFIHLKTQLGVHFISFLWRYVSSIQVIGYIIFAHSMCLKYKWNDI